MKEFWAAWGVLLLAMIVVLYHAVTLRNAILKLIRESNNEGL